MLYKTLQPVANRPYRIYVPWFLIKNFVLISLGVFCFQRAMQSGNLLWWIGIALAVWLGVLLASHFDAHRVMVSETHVIIRRGMLASYTQTVPIWSVEVGVRQGLLARACGYGTVRFQTTDHVIEIRQIARVHELCTTIQQRQAALLPLLSARLVSPNFYQAA